MQENRVKALWRGGGVAVMCGCSIGNTYASEIMAHAGFDALMLDQQHSPVDWAAMWLVAHPDLLRTARVRAVMDWLVEVITAARSRFKGSS